MSITSISTLIFIWIYYQTKNLNHTLAFYFEKIFTSSKVFEVFVPAIFTLVGALIGAWMIERNRKKEIEYKSKIRKEEHQRKFLTTLEVLEHDLEILQKAVDSTKILGSDLSPKEHSQVAVAFLISHNIEFPTLKREVYVQYFSEHPGLLKLILEIETNYKLLKIEFHEELLGKIISDIEEATSIIDSLKKVKSSPIL